CSTRPWSLVLRSWSVPCPWPLVNGKGSDEGQRTRDGRRTKANRRRTGCYTESKNGLGVARARPPGGQPDHYRRAASLACAFRVDAAAGKLDEVPDNREAQAETAVPARGRGICLSELVEDVR